MKIKNVVFGLSILFMLSCSKESVQPTPEPEPEPKPESKADASIITFFHATDPYFQPFVYLFSEETQTWSRRAGSHFSTISEEDPTYLGFTNPYVENSGVNLFHMVTLYQEKTGTNNIKTVAINADKVLRFFPDLATEANPTPTTGTVEVFAQKIKMYKAGGDIENRESMDYIEIGISGEGTYNTKTGVIDLDVHFDETSIDGPAKVTRQYKISKTAITF